MATHQKPLILAMVITWSWPSTFLLQQRLDDSRVISVSMPWRGVRKECGIALSMEFRSWPQDTVSRYRLLWSRAGLRNFNPLHRIATYTCITPAFNIKHCIFGPVAHTTKNRGIVRVKTVYSMCLLRTFEKSSNSQYLIGIY